MHNLAGNYASAAALLSNRNYGAPPRQNTAADQQNADRIYDREKGREKQ